MASLPPYSPGVETLGNKARRLLSVARVSNPIINPPLAPARAWGNSGTFIKNEFCAANGNIYANMTGGVTASTGGGPSATSGYIVDGTCTWWFVGPVQVSSASILAPSVSFFPQNGGLVGNNWAPYNSGVFFNGGYGNGHPNVLSFYGGVPLPASGAINLPYWSGSGYAQIKGPAITSGAASRNGPIGAKVEFMTNTLQLSCNISSAPDVGSVLVDDQYVSLGTTNNGNNGSNYGINLDFTNAGGRKPRRITLELPGNSGVLQSVATGNVSSVWAVPKSDIIRAIWVWDSYGAGSTYHPAQQCSDIPGLVGKLLGWRDTWNMSVGGTGWTNAGAALTFLARIPYDVVGWSPDVVVLPGSVNDNAASPSAITAAVISGVGLIRAAYPTVPIILTGVFGASGNLSAGTLANENAIRAAYTALADPRIWFIPISTDAVVPWVYGTGYVGNAQNNGPSDVLTAPDGTHPAGWLGTVTFARMLADRIANIISAIP